MGAPKGNKNAAGSHRGGKHKTISRKKTAYRWEGLKKSNPTLYNYMRKKVGTKKKK